MKRIIQYLLSVRDAAGLLTRFERQWLGELERDVAREAVQIINPADAAGPLETYPLRGPARIKAGYTEPSSYLLARAQIGLVAVTGERHTTAGDVDHLALRRSFIKVFRKPYWTVMTQPLLASSLYESFLFGFYFSLRLIYCRGCWEPGGSGCKFCFCQSIFYFFHNQFPFLVAEPVFELVWWHARDEDSVFRHDHSGSAD